jgi:hypothetical protein
MATVTVAQIMEAAGVLHIAKVRAARTGQWFDADQYEDDLRALIETYGRHQREFGAAEMLPVPEVRESSFGEFEAAL